MSIVGLLLIAFGSAFAVVYLISHYVPLISTWFGKTWSPRLLICSAFLGPFDVLVTTILICGAWIGVTTAVTGVGMMIYNVLTSIGLSIGVIFTKKVLAPRWRRKYNEIVDEQKAVSVKGELL
jgi:hypothetical protein